MAVDTGLLCASERHFQHPVSKLTRAGSRLFCGEMAFQDVVWLVAFGYSVVCRLYAIVYAIVYMRGLFHPFIPLPFPFNLNLHTDKHYVSLAGPWSLSQALLQHRPSAHYGPDGLQREPVDRARRHRQHLRQLPQHLLAGMRPAGARSKGVPRGVGQGRMARDSFAGREWRSWTW